MTYCGCETPIESREQTRVLILLLATDAVMFVVELAAGILAQSAGLLADSLDMLADVWLRARGFDARRLEAGFPEWRAAGMPVSSL